MIEINLLPGRKKKRSVGAGASLKGLLERVKDPLLATAVGVWVIVLAGAAFIFTSENRKVKGLQEEVAEISGEAEHFRTVIQGRRQQQDLHDLLISEFEEIRSIDASRFVWSHVMEEVTQALPEYTWIVGLEFIPQPTPAVTDPAPEAAPPAPTRFTVDGRTSDIGAYTRFLRQLGTSQWLTNIVPGATSTLIEENRPIIAFVVTGTYRQADSAFINVTPFVTGAQ